jgi:hypothetical protein
VPRPSANKRLFQLFGGYFESCGDDVDSAARFASSTRAADDNV